MLCNLAPELHAGKRTNSIAANGSASLLHAAQATTPLAIAIDQIVREGDETERITRLRSGSKEIFFVIFLGREGR